MWQTFADATANLPAAGHLFLEITLWGGWFLGLIAILTPSALSLTVIRMLAPVSVGSSAIAAYLQGASNVSLLTVSVALIGSVSIFLPSFGDPMINGSAYGPERRMALRPPTIMMFVLPLLWLAAFLVVASGVLLLANDRRLFGALITVVSIGVGFLSFNVFHQFSRRWLVFVPAGFVVHDYLQLLDAVLLQRKNTLRLSPAADEDADKTQTADLSRTTYGLALAAHTKENVELTLRDRKQNKTLTTDTIIFTPTLPGKVIKEAQIRGIKT